MEQSVKRGERQCVRGEKDNVWEENKQKEVETKKVWGCEWVCEFVYVVVVVVIASVWVYVCVCACFSYVCIVCRCLFADICVLSCCFLYALFSEWKFMPIRAENQHISEPWPSTPYLLMWVCQTSSAFNLTAKWRSGSASVVRINSDLQAYFYKVDLRRS